MTEIRNNLIENFQKIYEEGKLPENTKKLFNKTLQN